MNFRGIGGRMLMFVGAFLAVTAGMVLGMWYLSHRGSQTANRLAAKANAGV